MNAMQRTEEVANSGSAGLLATLQRGLAVLEYVAKSEMECTAADIASALGLSRGVTYHLLRTLVHDGFLVRTSGGSFLMGPRLGTLFDRYQDQLKPAEHLLHTLHALRASTGESVYITGWSNRMIAIKYYLEGEGAVRVRRTSIGYGENAHARAAARAILAFIPEKELGRYLPKGPLPKIGPKTVTSARALLENLRKIRETGLSFEEEEFSAGVACLGSPVFDSSGAAVAAIGMSVVLSEFLERFDELAAAVHSAAEEASRDSGWTGAYPNSLGLSVNKSELQFARSRGAGNE